MRARGHRDGALTLRIYPGSAKICVHLSYHFSKWKFVDTGSPASSCGHLLSSPPNPRDLKRSAVTAGKPSSGGLDGKECLISDEWMKNE